MPNAALFVSPGPLVDGSGNPYAFSKLNFYTTGTSTPLNTYSDSALSSANTNPVVADINGKFGPIYLFANTSYKVVFTTSADSVLWTWDPVQGVSIGITPSVGLLRSYLSGLTLSRASATSLGVAAGACADSTNTLAMSVAAGTINCATTGVNGLDTGALANTTWYHAFAIAKVDGTVALLASLSASSPTLPTGYTLKRRIGSVKTNGSAQILDFSQQGDEFLWAAAISEWNSTSVPTSATLVTLLGIPTGVKVEATMRVEYSNANTSGFLLQSPDETSAVAGATTGNADLIGNASTNNTAGAFRRRSNTSAQLRWSANAASGTARGATYGWIDRRGRDD